MDHAASASQHDDRLNVAPSRWRDVLARLSGATCWRHLARNRCRLVKNVTRTFGTLLCVLQQLLLGRVKGRQQRVIPRLQSVTDVLIWPRLPQQRGTAHDVEALKFRPRGAGTSGRPVVVVAQHRPGLQGAMHLRIYITTGRHLKFWRLLQHRSKQSMEVY